MKKHFVNGINSSKNPVAHFLIKIPIESAVRFPQGKGRRSINPRPPCGVFDSFQHPESIKGGGEVAYGGVTG